MKKHYDLAVIGGGSAGYAAASTAAGLGLDAAVIEGGAEVGGLCILRGCMPSKTLIESANRAVTIRRAREFGLRAGELSVEGGEIIERKKRLVAEFGGHRRQQLESGPFDFIRGRAAFTGPHTAEVTHLDGEPPTAIEAKTFLIATGSCLETVEIPGLCETGFHDSDEVLECPEIPGSVIVLGGGATALEFAHYYAGLGAKVTILQRSAHVLKEMDVDVAAALATAFRHRGISIFLGTHLLRVEGANGKKRVHFRHERREKSVEGSEIIYALGRKPHLAGLRLDRAGVRLENGRLTLNASLQTEAGHIFAAGDAAGPYEIVHIAAQQGELAARNAARIVRAANPAQPLEKIDYRLKIFAIFSMPEAAAVGMTEKELAAAGIPHLAASHPFNDHGKSLVIGETEGFVKLIVAPESREILGAAAVGAKASELIHEIVVAMYFRATAGDLAQIPHYHPTLSEIWTYPAEELARKPRA